MNETEKNKELFKLLTYIYAEWGKVFSDEIFALWRDQLKGIPRSLAWKAARLLAGKKTYGEPKFQDFYACLLEVWPKRRVGSQAHGYHEELEPIESILPRIISEHQLALPE